MIDTNVTLFVKLKPRLMVNQTGSNVEQQEKQKSQDEDEEEALLGLCLTAVRRASEHEEPAG